MKPQVLLLSKKDKRELEVFMKKTTVLSKKWVTLSVLEEGVVVWGEIGAS
jgi:hypothetical protein